MWSILAQAAMKASSEAPARDAKAAEEYSSAAFILISFRG
jgi:hypothetical protein